MLVDKSGVMVVSDWGLVNDCGMVICEVFVGVWWVILLVFVSVCRPMPCA